MSQPSLLGAGLLTWVDVTSIVLDLVTLLVVARAVREIKISLDDARNERLDINRRLEVLSRRVDKRQHLADADRQTETIP